MRIDEDVLEDLATIAKRHDLDVADLVRRGARMVVAAELPPDDEDRKSSESAEDRALRERGD